MKIYKDIVQIREALLNGSFFNPKKLVADSVEDVDEAKAIVDQLGDAVTEEGLILLQKALRLDPNNPDIYIRLGEYEKRVEARVYYWNRLANSKYERAIKTHLAESGQDVWEDEDTRAYLKTKAEYAKELIKEDYTDAAILEYRKILELDPKDHLNLKVAYGILLLEFEEEEAFEELLQMYEGQEVEAGFLFNHALYLFKKEKGRSPKANSLLVKADQLNPLITIYLMNAKLSLSWEDMEANGIFALDEEAQSYVSAVRYLWEETKGTQRWLHNFHRKITTGK
ncbi:hypothetical protein [Saprospira grandis]|uniref:Tetratricopeptide TPR_2 n=1 Tax=Saprospira grandis (strain Lewin) TaxID=984262 RepID=H6L650_SAPGL|nr:hypothetical protein [Saprospira grandis]AFC22951.1 tetratricopeptide TPR_2 [Saprospira grandis str. Lewin]